MKRNNAYRQILTILSVVALLSFGIYCYVSAQQSQQDSDNYSSFGVRLASVGRIESEITNAEIPLSQMGEIKDELVKQLGKYKSDNRTTVREIIVSAITGSITGVVNKWLKQLDETMTGPDLVRSLESINIAIDEYIMNDIDIAIYQRSGTGYNDTYQRLIDRYGDLSNYYRREANNDVFGKWDFTDRSEDLENMKSSLPDANEISVSRCATPTGTCYGYFEDANNHLATCTHKHGVSGETNVEYWVCQSPDRRCHRTSEHWVECRGATCKELFPPPTVHIGGSYIYSHTDYHDHEKVCKVSVYSWWNSNATCDKTWFPCEGGCPHRVASGLFPTQTSIARYATHNVKLITDEPYRNVYWYVRPPGASNDMATFVKKDTGDGSTTEAFMSYTFNSTHPTGQWTVRAYISTGDNNVIDAEYPLYVTD